MEIKYNIWHIDGYVGRATVKGNIHDNPDILGNN